MEPSQSARTLYRSASRAAWLGLVINLVLGLIKLVGGIVGNTFALISDAVNSLGDVFASLVVLLGLHIAQRPPDEEHPYGHTRAESIAGSYVALLIIASAMMVGWEAIQRLSSPHGIPPIWTLWIAGANVLIKEGLYHYKLRIADKTGSTSLIANAWDHRSDALCSLAVLIGLGLVRWGGAKWNSADEIAALFVVAAITWSGIQLVRQSSSELMDLQADEPFLQRVREAAAQAPEVKAVEKLWVRKSGLEYFADIHIQVDASMTVSEGHHIGHRVKDQLMVQFPSLRDVLVHLEPYPHLHEEASPPAG